MDKEDELKLWLELPNNNLSTDNGIKWNLNKLKNEGVLERIGADKGGYWKIINK